MMADEEHWLVLKAQEGCPKSFDQLLARHEKPVFRHVHRMVRSDDDAYDALQQTFLTVVKSIRQLRQRESFRPWLFGVATRVCLKMLSRRRPTVALGEDIEEEAPDTAPSPEGAALANERRDLLLDLVLTLSPRIRSVMLLHFYEGLSLADVAAALEISPGTAKSRLAAGLQKLRSHEEVRDHEPRTRTG